MKSVAKMATEGVEEREREMSKGGKAGGLLENVKDKRDVLRSQSSM